jgi:hypothetical protein
MNYTKETLLEGITENLKNINKSLRSWDETLSTEMIIEENISYDDDELPNLYIESDNDYLLYYLSKEDIKGFVFGESDNEFIVKAKNTEYVIVIVFI